MAIADCIQRKLARTKEGVVLTPADFDVAPEQHPYIFDISVEERHGSE